VSQRNPSIVLVKINHGNEVGEVAVTLGIQRNTPKTQFTGNFDECMVLSRAEFVDYISSGEGQES